MGRTEYFIEDGRLYCKRGKQEVEVTCTVEDFLRIIERQVSTYGKKD